MAWFIDVQQQQQSDRENYVHRVFTQMTSSRTFWHVSWMILVFVWVWAEEQRNTQANTLSPLLLPVTVTVAHSSMANTHMRRFPANWLIVNVHKLIWSGKMCLWNLWYTTEMVNPTFATIKRNDVQIQTKCSRLLFIYMKANGFRWDQVRIDKRNEKENGKHQQ